MCETSAHHGPHSGHEASSRQQDSAVLVSLMTAAVADNDQDSCESLCRCPLVRRKPEEIFVCVCVFLQLWHGACLQNGFSDFCFSKCLQISSRSKLPGAARTFPTQKNIFGGLNMTKDAISEV